MAWRRLFYLVALAASASVSGGAAPQRPEPPPPAMPPAPEDAIYALPSADDAVRLAFVDAQAAVAAGFDGRFLRYVWIQDGTDESAAAARNALALVSRAPYLPLLPAVRHKDVLLLRVDLAQEAPQQDAAAQDLVDYLREWDSFEFDPAFSLLLTKDELRFAGIKEEELPKVKKVVGKVVKRTVQKTRKVTKKVKLKWPGGKDANGVTQPAGKEYEDEKEVDEPYTEEVEEVVPEQVEVNALDEDAVVKLNPRRAIDPAAFVGLQEILHTPAPVVSDGYFITRGLSTIRDEKVNQVFATVYGGEYYRLRGIKKAKDVKGKEKYTDFDLFLENLGVGFLGQKESIKADQIFDRLRSDQRIAMFHSGVTDKERRIDLFDSLDGREFFPWVAVTHDFKDANIDLGTSPVANLSRVDADAFEVIAVTANGTLIYALFDGQGNLLDEAAFDVVLDHEIPSPHTQRLQSAISCIRCHGKRGNDGWQDMTNDVTTLLAHGFDLFADISDPDRSQRDVRDRLRGLYMGDFSVALQSVRNDQARTTLRAGGILWKDDVGQKETAWKVSQRISDRYADYNFGTVDAKRALRDLGVHAPASKELETLRAVLPPVEGLPVDPRLAGLLSGISIPPHDWQLILGFVSDAAKPNIIKMLQHPQDN